MEYLLTNSKRASIPHPNPPPSQRRGREKESHAPSLYLWGKVGQAELGWDGLSAVALAKVGGLPLSIFTHFFQDGE